MPDDSRGSWWAAPGVTVPAGPGPEAADVAALSRAVDEALAVVPSALSEQAAVGRAEGLLAVQERVAALALKAVADVDARELWRVRAAGSTRTWLRTLPCGDRGQLALARLLLDRPVLAEALADGTVSVRTAAGVARELSRVPAHVDAAQLEGVLVDGVGDLLGVWAGAACLDPTPAQEVEFEVRRARLTEAVRTGRADCWSDAAGQLEPAFVLAAQVLAPAEVEAGLRLLVDALQPEADLDALSEREHRSRGLVLRKLAGGGWSLRAHLTDETGQLLFDALDVRQDTHPLQKARATRAATSGTTVEDVPGLAPGAGAETADACATGADADGDADADPDADADADADPDTAAHHAPAQPDDRWGAAGPGGPVSPSGEAEEGTPLASADQRAHDALARLLADLSAVRPGSGVPAARSLTLVSGVEALEGRPGAPPGRLVTAKGDVALAPGRLRRHACGSLLAAVLQDARGRPVAASGQHRHATQRDRRAMRAAWGSGCAVNGCTLPGEVPHHAEPFWRSGETVLKDLVPVCEHHHHDVHDGHKTLRLRDGRLLDEWGWADRR